MSRYTIENDKHLEITVGWDDPLATFFVHVIEHTLDDDNFLVDIGGMPAEVTSIDEVINALGDYATLPLDVQNSLLHDKAHRREPTQFQRTTYKGIFGEDLP